MSDIAEGNNNPVGRPVKRKVLIRKRENRDDIFSYRNQIPLSFKAKQVKLKVDDSDSSDSEDVDEAFHRVMEQELETKNSRAKESDSEVEDDIWITSDKSMEEIDSSTSDIRDVSWTNSPSPPPCPPLSESTLMKINQRRVKNPTLRELDNVLENLKKSTNTSWSPCDSYRPSTVINVDSLDDSYSLPSPSERDVVVKVRTRSGMRRFTIKAAEPFGKIISQLAEQEGVTEDKIMLSLSDINILGYDTPISVKLNVADIIECVVMPMVAGCIDVGQTDKISIKVQGNDADSKKTLRVSKSEPLEKLMTEYCKFRQLNRSRLKFLFDGDEITGRETPVDLDMEEDDVIDVRVK